MDESVTIAGHPLVRSLRRDAEREVWVAADASGAGVEVHRGIAGGDAVLAAEAEALLAVAHPHLVPILDVAVDDGVVLVRPLLPHDLAEWLVERQAPAPGEAVTALAPIAAALGALHGAGASGGGCTAGDVRLDGDGAPLLLGAGASIETARPTEAWRMGSEGVAADVDGWRGLADAVLGAAGAALPSEAAAALEARDLDAAGRALLRAWAALPLELEGAPPLPRSTRAPLRQRERPVGLEAVWSRAALLAEQLAARGGGMPAGALRRCAAALQSVRPRFWAIAVGGGAALVVTAALLWPAGSTGADARSALPTTSAAGAPGPEPAAGSTDGDIDAAAAAASGEPAPRAAPSTGTEPEADPLTAAAALLAEREACIDAGDAACLVALHEPESPQLAAAQPWRMPDDGTLELGQRLGDAWLLRVRSEREPASVLVMSTEAGWTLRDAWSD